MGLWSLTSPEPFDITHPTNNKHNAIIQIRHIVGGYTCTAFVVSDKMAVTAGHCVNITESFMLTGYKKIMKESEEIQRKTITYLKRIEDECIGPHCESLYYQTEERLKIEVDAYNKGKTMKPDVLSVYNIYGEDTKIKATPLFKEVKTRDHAVIKGDFRKFNKLILASGFDIEFRDNLRSCGYAGSKTPPICIDVTYISNIQFYLYGYGLMLKGMSGGPVINEDGLVVGINSRVPGTGVMFSPILGVFNRTFKKPKKKVPLAKQVKAQFGR